MPLVEMRDVSLSFGGLRAVDRASIDLYADEVLTIAGHNCALGRVLILRSALLVFIGTNR